MCGGPVLSLGEKPPLPRHWTLRSSPAGPGDGCALERHRRLPLGTRKPAFASEPDSVAFRRLQRPWQEDPCWGPLGRAVTRRVANPGFRFRDVLEFLSPMFSSGRRWAAAPAGGGVPPPGRPSGASCVLVERPPGWGRMPSASEEGALSRPWGHRTLRQTQPISGN